ncbi:MAG: pirin family protein [Myxococcota bacterium]
MPWPTQDPFLFCVHHLDAYPRGDARMGPDASLEGRDLGMDFELRDGFRMYHGQVVPGFPAHPHRGFETVTLARQGLIDHADSLGATARFGRGDVQWMTAGQGILHSEMFPLVHQDRSNPVELFQIWLNLPARNKLTAPHFAMLWAPDIPIHRVADTRGRITTLVTVAGPYDGQVPPSPPPRSWASEPESDVAIWTLRLEAGASFQVPHALGGETRRSLYFFSGDRIRVDGEEVEAHMALHFDGGSAIELENADAESELLMLQGRPIGEAVAHHGPFVMNTREELVQAILDYEKTGFGGWSWSTSEPVHPREARRFARHADGRTEEGPY